MPSGLGARVEGLHLDGRGSRTSRQGRRSAGSDRRRCRPAMMAAISRVVAPTAGMKGRDGLIRRPARSAAIRGGRRGPRGPAAALALPLILALALGRCLGRLSGPGPATVTADAVARNPVGAVGHHHLAGLDADSTAI